MKTPRLKLIFKPTSMDDNAPVVGSVESTADSCRRSRLNMTGAKKNRYRQDSNLRMQCTTPEPQTEVDSRVSP